MKKWEINKKKTVTICEALGSILAVGYAISIASNTGNEIIGFIFLELSALFFAIWGIIDKRWSFFSLQVFYMFVGIFGLMRWS
ncbi:hypothetical protein [Oceanivirga salmonicida]|uniref:hypothetical protein n=1 Tax=Oceanivirga salmonicida TaxID=1769291 RepID=UPI0018CC6EA9|nr:hypothetical protein [Oceanivirga salmonicida]